MNTDTQSVDQTVSAMADVLTKYLNTEEVRQLTTQWQQYSAVSVKMMQQCVLDATRRYPELKAHKSDIRKGFWDTLQADSQQATKTDKHSDTADKQSSASEIVLAFYTVMETFSHQLTPVDHRNLMQTMHQTVAQERTFKGHRIDIHPFLEGHRPVLPDDEYILNNMIQLAYVCLCDITGPVEADEILFRAAETAKQHHAKTVVEKLF